MFRKKPVVQEPAEWLIVGLGNPGPEYRGTRHNVGFEMIDRLATRGRIKLDRSRHRARIGVGRLGDRVVVLAKPLTFMNLSGQSVAPLAREFGIPPDRVLVLADDKDLALGKVRFKEKGSAGGHNGHRSIIAALRTEAYPRLKIGIGSGERGQAIDHVLGGFTPEERAEIDRAIDEAIARCDEILRRPSPPASDPDDL